MSTRAERRQHLRIVRSTEHIREARRRGLYRSRTKLFLDQIEVEPVGPDDREMQAFISHMKITHAERYQRPSVAWSQGAVYLVARRKSTKEPLGCFAITVMPPDDKALVEDFFVVDGRWGKFAAFRMVERLRLLKRAKVGFVAVENKKWLETLESFGMRVVGYIVEGGTA